MNTDEHGWSAPHARRVGADPGSPQHHPCSSVFICVHLWFQSLPCCQAGKDRMGLRAVSARGAVRTIRAATLRICQRADAGRRGGVGGRGWHSAPFRQIAQLPYATVWRPMRAGGVVSVAEGHSAAFRQIAQLPYATRSGPAAGGWSGFRPDGAAGGRGGARNAKFVQGPYATWSRPAVPGWPGFRPAGAAGGCGGRGMRFPCKDPMERRVDQKGRNGRGSARTAGLAGVAEHGMRFRAAALCNGEPGSSAGLDGRVHTEWRGWRLCGARNRFFRQRPYGPGGGSAGPAWSGCGPAGAAGGCGRARNRFFRQRPYGPGGGAVGRGGHRVGVWPSAGRAVRSIRARPYEPGYGVDGPGGHWVGAWPSAGRAVRNIRTRPYEPRDGAVGRGWPPGWRLAQRRGHGPRNQDKTL
jgi:hypothetical protein